MKTYFEDEKRCEATFQLNGPYWHASTPGKETPILFPDEKSFIFVMNVIAEIAYSFKGIRILAHEVMVNHFHFVISGPAAEIKAFWAALRKRLARTFPLVGSIEIKVKPINDLTQLRNNIVYTNRNGYIVSPDCTPFSYPWGTGRYYFLDSPASVPLSDLRYSDRREMFRCKTPSAPLDWRVTDGFVSPECYCDIKLGMSMFRDAHHYFYSLCKNVESHSALSADLEEAEYLTDCELYPLLAKSLETQYNVSKVSELTKAQKLDVARYLHKEYRSSNGQIRRLLHLSQYEVDELFPLKADRSK